jgi:hypothetical protein
VPCEAAGVVAERVVAASTARGMMTCKCERAICLKLLRQNSDPKVLSVTQTPSRFWHGDNRWKGHETKRAIAMKKASMFLALNLALAAPVGAVTLAVIGGTTAVMTVHPRQALAKLQHFRLVRHS